MPPADWWDTFVQILIWDSLNAVIVEASKPFCDTQGDRRRGMLHAPVFEKEASELMKDMAGYNTSSVT